MTGPLSPVGLASGPPRGALWSLRPEVRLRTAAAASSPATGKEIKKTDKWDMGHKPGQEFRKHQEEARARGDTRKGFLDDHNNPNKYRPETPNTNRSQKLEDKSDQYGGD